MKLKSFRDLIKEKFNKEEIKEIERKANLESKALTSLQEVIKEAIDKYMKNHNIGINEMARRLGSNVTQLLKIRRKQANLTLASIAQISAQLGQGITLKFKNCDE